MHHTSSIQKAKLNKVTLTIQKLNDKKEKKRFFSQSSSPSNEPLSWVPRSMLQLLLSIIQYRNMECRQH